MRSEYQRYDPTRFHLSPVSDCTATPDQRSHPPYPRTLKIAGQPVSIPRFRPTLSEADGLAVSQDDEDEALADSPL